MLRDQITKLFEAAAVFLMLTNALSIAFQRDAAGRITNIVDALGHAMSYCYDTTGNLAAFVNREIGRA